MLLFSFSTGPELAYNELMRNPYLEAARLVYPGDKTAEQAATERFAAEQHAGSPSEVAVLISIAVFMLALFAFVLYMAGTHW